MREGGGERQRGPPTHRGADVQTHREHGKDRDADRTMAAVRAAERVREPRRLEDKPGTGRETASKRSRGRGAGLREAPCVAG